MLRQQNIYWKQRGTVKWVKLGDENTKFFHAHATIKHRKNLISSIQAPDGSQAVSHADKALIIWESFKERLGTSEFTTMHFNLDDLILEASGLEYP